ncbi:MAG: hypothetical protein ACOC6F_00065 [bacterium]
MTVGVFYDPSHCRLDGDMEIEAHERLSQQSFYAEAEPVRGTDKVFVGLL